MKKKLNCWEYFDCGREEGGKKAEEFGVCPVFTETKADNINSGKNGGRSCWAIAGTFCEGEIQGTFTDKLKGCIACKFFKKVYAQEKKTDSYTMPLDILRLLNEK